MADPVSIMAITGMAATGVGALTKAVGSEYSGAAESNMYQYQAGVATVNAQIAKQDANYTISAGDVQAQEGGMQEEANIGATRAASGASNIAGGSQNRVVSSEIEVGQQTQGIIRADAAKRAYGYEVGAAGDTATASALGVAAETSKTTGGFGAASSILGGVASVSDKWLQTGPAFGQGGQQATDTGYTGFSEFG
jgi:hypothetical protein